MKKKFLIAILFITISSKAQPPQDSVETYQTVPKEYDDENKLFDKVEVEGSFPGGDKAWAKFLQKNLDASIPVKNGVPAGSYTVRIRFIVNKDGTVNNINALTKHGYGMEKACIQVIKKSGKWVPAIHKRKKVKAYRKQPITFIIAEE